MITVSHGVITQRNRDRKLDKGTVPTAATAAKTARKVVVAGHGE
jgi:hypothetical protein